MEKMKLAIIEDNRDLCELLSSYINEHYVEAFDVVGIAHDGANGLNLLTSTKPDIALIDIVLPIMDGLNILEKLQSMYLLDQICCVMFTAVSHDAITRRAMDLGAKYYFIKPFDTDNLLKRLLQITQDIRTNTEIKPDITQRNFRKRAVDNTPERYATTILQTIGIPANLTGYYYLRRAIVRCIEDETLLDGLTKVLYPSIGKEFKTTGQRVERSIRHSIEKAWDSDCADAYYKALGRIPPENKSKPSNGMFIMEMVDYYRSNISQQS